MNDYLSFAAQIIGTIGGILISARLTNYRIEQLEKKVEKHNNVVERTSLLEYQVELLLHEKGEV